MSVMRFAIMQLGQEWKVVSSRRTLGHFADYESAFAVGASLVQEAKDCGHTVEFLVQAKSGEVLDGAPLQSTPRYRVRASSRFPNSSSAA
jgi:hypothetical protein